MIVTNTSALQLSQAMLDALASTNAAITAALLARTNGWAQYDALVQQTNATVRLYQPDSVLRWMHLTPTNPAVTLLVADAETNYTAQTSLLPLWGDWQADTAAATGALAAAVLGAGYVTESVTNGLASTQHVAAAAAGLAALYGTNAVLRAALTNEAALRAAGDAAGLAAGNATNAVLSAAITNEAALRAAGDAAGLAALYGTNAVLRAALTNEVAPGRGRRRRPGRRQRHKRRPKRRHHQRGRPACLRHQRGRQSRAADVPLRLAGYRREPGGVVRFRRGRHDYRVQLRGGP